MELKITQMLQELHGTGAFNSDSLKSNINMKETLLECLTEENEREERIMCQKQTELRQLVISQYFEDKADVYSNNRADGDDMSEDGVCKREEMKLLGVIDPKSETKLYLELLEYKYRFPALAENVQKQMTSCTKREQQRVELAIQEYQEFFGNIPDSNIGVYQDDSTKVTDKQGCTIEIMEMEMEGMKSVGRDEIERIMTKNIHNIERVIRNLIYNIQPILCYNEQQANNASTEDEKRVKDVLEKKFQIVEKVVGILKKNKVGGINKVYSIYTQMIASELYGVNISIKVGDGGMMDERRRYRWYYNKSYVEYIARCADEYIMDLNFTSDGLKHVENENVSSGSGKQKKKIGMEIVCHYLNIMEIYISLGEYRDGSVVSEKIKYMLVGVVFGQQGQSNYSKQYKQRGYTKRGVLASNMNIDVNGGEKWIGDEKHVGVGLNEDVQKYQQSQLGEEEEEKGANMRIGKAVTGVGVLGIQCQKDKTAVQAV
ncbi:hypothetical protein AX774_g519 [Zancudomyces culisetae]|uniref:Uncharacterized protein n=1 Tax=Zancudomyces culisetae TaxID=1213189 RepID=A0A1R1PYC7_ZANCU|nr:hypothetical protein AX774_g519 [Zancudomyces culisetae]|eukprot:OMH85938.1 hypothetical protein AX774_g519 [Zancudomyces culisetae]